MCEPRPLSPPYLQDLKFKIFPPTKHIQGQSGLDCVMSLQILMSRNFIVSFTIRGRTNYNIYLNRVIIY